MAGFFERFESSIDRQIEEATKRGEFDGLPGAGRPLSGDIEPYSEDWWLKNLARRENIGPYALPEPLALRREAQDLSAGLLEANNEAEARALVDSYNERADAARRRPHAGPSVIIPAVDADEAIAEWRRRRDESTRTEAVEFGERRCRDDEEPRVPWRVRRFLKKR